MQAATTEVRAITVDEMQAQAEALTVAHWAEVGGEGVKTLDVDWDRYRLLERVKVLVLLGGYVDGVLVGYGAAIRGNHGHDKGEKLLHGDAIFVAPQNRGTGLGLALLRHTEAVAKSEGIDSVLWGGPEGGPLVRLLKRMHDYRKREVIYAKRVM